MSDVTRYDLKYCHGEGGGEMLPDSSGLYVLYGDYEAVHKELETIKAESPFSRRVYIAKLEATLKRRTEALEAVEKEIRNELVRGTIEGFPHDGPHAKLWTGLHKVVSSALKDPEAPRG